MSIYWDDRGHCPKCGKFCGQIEGKGNEMRGLFEVTGVCKKHGKVDLTGQSWSWDEFFGEPECIGYLDRLEMIRRIP